MLSGSEILEEVEKGNLSISYSFLPFDSSGNQLDRYAYQGKSIKASKENKEALEYLKGQIVRDRIAMSAGAIYRPFSSGRVAKNMRFKGHRDLVDITKDKGYFMKPGEVGLVLSNECIDFKSDHSALILTRVSNYPIGLVIQAAYIDSTSMGLLRFVLTNVSDKPVRLRVGQDLARVFVFKTSNPLGNDRIMGEVSTHYGQNWPNIINDGLHPFQSLRENEVWHPTHELKAWLKNNGLAMTVGTILLGIFAATPFLYGLTDGIRKLSTLANSVKQLEEKNRIKANEIKDLNSRRRLQGTTTITIGDGRAHASKTIKIVNKQDIKTGSLYLSTNEHNESVSITGIMELNSNNITINIRASRKGTDGDELRNVKWVVFPM